MNAHEINIAIEQVVNWQPPPEEMGNITHDGGRFVSAEEWREQHRPDYHGSFAALSLIEAAGLEGWKWYADNRRGTFHVAFWQGYDDETVVHTADEETLFAAICTAFLKTKGLWT